MSGQAKVTLLLELRNRLRAGMGQARGYISKNVNSIKAKLGELRAAHTAAFEAMSERMPAFGNMISMLANPYALVTAAVLSLAVAYGKAMALSKEWQTSMAKVNVTAQLGKKDLNALSGELRKIGRDNVVDLMQVPEAFNKILSAGLDTNTALKTLDPTLKAAKASFTEIEIVAAAAVSTMNSSGIMDATRVYDILFATLNKGNAEFSDIANYLPKIIPGARQAGFDLEQTAGAFAFLTAQGLKAEAASTALSNAFKSLSTPEIIYGGKSKGGFKALGIDIFDASGKMKNMVEIASALNSTMNGLTDEQRVKKFASIGLDMEAATAFSIMSQNVDNLKDSIDFTTNSAGQLTEAVKNSAEPMDSWRKLANQVKDAMVGAGSPGVVLFGQIGDKILEVVDNIRQLYNESIFFQDVISAVGTAFKVVWWTATRPIVTLWNLLKFVWGILTEIKVAVFGAGDGFENMYLKVKPYILWIYQYLSGVAGLLGNIATFDFDGAKESIEQLASAKSLKQLKQQVVIEAAENKKRIADEKDPPQLATQGGIQAPAATGPTNPSTTTGNYKSDSAASKVTGMQGQPKNITINMDAMFKMGDMVSQNKEVASMSKRELESWFQEMTIRMMRNLETSFS